MIQVLLKNIHSALGNRNVVFLRHMNIAVPHLVTKKMCRRIHFSHHGSEGVPQKMILEVDPQFGFDLP